MVETEYFQGRSIDEKHERAYLRRIVGWVLVSLLVLWAVYPKEANADPVYRAQVGEVTVTVYNDPCQVKEVTNLPFRATWLEKGVLHEGCFSYAQHVESLMMYFSTDKTVAVIPVSIFKPVQGV